MPSSLSAWDDWVRAVVSRYKGRIDEYQAWNEVNFASFWSGTVGEMITLTQRSSKIVKQVDPRAEFVTGSAIVRQPKTKREAQRHQAGRRGLQEEFLVQLPQGPEEAKVKFDAVGMHLYPWYKAGPGTVRPTTANVVWPMRSVFSTISSSSSRCMTRRWPTATVATTGGAKGPLAVHGCGISGADLHLRHDQQRSTGLLVRLGRPRSGRRRHECHHR